MNLPELVLQASRDDVKSKLEQSLRKLDGIKQLKITTIKMCMLKKIKIFYTQKNLNLETLCQVLAISSIPLQFTFFSLHSPDKAIKI